MMLGVLATLTAFVAVSALTVNQPLLSRGTAAAQEESDSWGDEPQSESTKSQLTPEADPYEVSLAQQESLQSTKQTPNKDDPDDYQVPFNLTNGACVANKAPRFVMEIKNVEQGSFYVGKMDIGTPPQTFNMLLDTGSDEIVAKGKGCIGCKGGGFDTYASTSWQRDLVAERAGHGKEEIAYGSGEVRGQRGFDTVSMGELTSDAGNPMMVIESTDVSEFDDDSKDALEVIVGMAPGLPEYTGNKLASHMQVRHFSECLPKNSNENGFFVVNDDHPAEKGFNGPFSSMGNFYWALAVQDFRLMSYDRDGNPIAMPPRLGEQGTSYSMLADTGTTLLSVPQAVLDDLDKELRKLDYDCSEMDKLPDLVFNIDGVVHKLPPSTYIAESDDSGFWGMQVNKEKPAGFSRVSAEHRANYYFKNTEFKNKKTGAYCELLFTEPVTMNSTLGEIGILGMPFFRNYIISFDFCTRQIWTKPSTGDCSHAVGQKPSNKQTCEDGDDYWGCFWIKAKAWLKENVLDGLASIFTENKKVKTAARLKVKPGSERMSQMAKWLIKGEKQTVVEI